MKYIPTGNMMVALPCLRESDAAIENFTFLHMASKGMIDVRGTDEEPLIKPFFEINGEKFAMANLSWSRIGDWIPSFSGTVGTMDSLIIEGIILAPVDERGFGVKISITNMGKERADAGLGLHLCWAKTLHSVNEDKEILGAKHCYRSNWNESYVFDLRLGLPLFSFAPMCVEASNVSEVLAPDMNGLEENENLRLKILRKAALQASETLTLTVFFGLGYEEVAAATSAKEMLRQGWDYEYENTLNWLLQRTYPIKDKKISKIYHENLFFCLFYALGVTLDTEELVSVTSRSSRYYVSAAYWDRDSLLWAFPAILAADKMLAREMLLYVFGRQRRNIGVHSRFIDGTVLEPGFELDELMAPIIALNRYIEATKDNEILEKADLIEGISLILAKLTERKHPEIPLFSTFLQPTDDEIVYPYLTYNNALVWFGLTAIKKLYPGCYKFPAAPEEIKDAIWANCVKEINGKKRFAWSLDLKGNFDVYDEPPGSLLLLPYYGFLEPDHPVYAATAEHIRSADYEYSFAGNPIAEIGCPHAPHPWILSIANSLLCGYEETAFNHLRLTEMDNGIACESVDEKTGECTTGAAFATCAGFLCHAIHSVFEKEKDACQDNDLGSGKARSNNAE
ncbi:MAG: glycoside hydrolase family 125 protein [Lachnospiraceae bacterium]|nr:glycoside hydrolase family 125 protein [Lachnospiraceae bacterium]